MTSLAVPVTGSGSIPVFSCVLFEMICMIVLIDGVARLAVNFCWNSSVTRLACRVFPIVAI